jgi:hypothetical protein
VLALGKIKLIHSFILIFIQHFSVTIHSKTEGRVSLTLEAYNSHQITSLRAATNTYDVPFETIRARHLGVFLQADTTANSRKLSNNEEQVLLLEILQLSADGFPPQYAVVEEMANTMLYTKNPFSPQRAGTKWVTNFFERYSELSNVYKSKFDV